MTKAILFDLDGVLTDTSEYHFEAWRRLAAEEGISFTRKDNDRLRGVSRRQSLEYILGTRKVSEKEAQELMERKNAYYVDYVAHMKRSDILPGVVPLLTYLRRKSLKSAIVSGSRNARLVADRTGLTKLVDAIVDGSRAKMGKPDPALFEIAAQELGVPPGECVAVEDAAAGVEAAHRAGMACIGVGASATGAEHMIARIGALTPAAFFKLTVVVGGVSGGVA